MVRENSPLFYNHAKDDYYHDVMPGELAMYLSSSTYGKKGQSDTQAPRGKMGADGQCDNFRGVAQ